VSEGLKPGWRRVKFGDVVRQVKDRVDPEDSGLERYIAGEHMDTDDLKLRRWGEIGADYLGPAFHMRFKPGHVLYGSRRTYLRKVAVADFEGITANTTFVLEPKDPNVLLPELLPFLMQTERFNEHSIKQSRGSVNPYVNFSDLAWYEFALPPLEEQRRMAHALELVGRLSEQLAQSATSAEQLRDALSLQYFSSPLERYQKRCAEIIDAGELTLQTGPFGTVLKASSYKSTGYPIVNPVNMKSGSIWVENGPFIGEEDWLRLKKYTMKQGDLVIGRKGDMSNLIFVRPEHNGYLVGSDCIRFRISSERINNRYFFHFLKSNVTKRWIQRQAYGTVMPGINEKILGRLIVFLPDVDKQEAIAQDFDAIESSLDRISERRQALGRFKMSLLASQLPEVRSVH